MTEDNAIQDDPGAVLITNDATGVAAVQFVWVKDLSMEDYERFTKAVNVMADIRGNNMFAYVREAGLGLARELGEAYKALYENRISHVQMEEAEQWCIRLRTAVLALCSSIHHHQDQSYIEVKRKYGKDSAEHEAAKAVFAELFDNSFGYRYLSKLRNAMVHYSMFAAGVGMESHRNDGDPIHLVDLTLDRSILLEQSDFLNATLRADLQQHPEDPQIIEMMGEAFSELRLANRKIVEIINPDFGEICSTVVEFDLLFGGQDGVRALSKGSSPIMQPGMQVQYHPVSGDSIVAARAYVADQAG